MTSESTDPQLEQHLAKLTEWEGDAPQVWKKALAEVDAGENPGASQPGIIARIGAWPWQRKVLGVAAMLAMVCAVAVSVPGLIGSQERHTSLAMMSPGPDASTGNLRSSGAAEQTYQRDWNGRQWTDPPGAVSQQGQGGAFLGGGGGDLLASEPSEGPLFLGGGGGGFPAAPARRARTLSGQATADDSERAVIHKATLELTTDDVRATYLKANLLVSQARGEFIDGSTIQGENEYAEANLTLRVLASRLDEVLNQLRELGAIISENRTGDDVTTQLIDLEARLRNELRVEEELLDLMAARNDAPLKDVLQLRNEIGNIRQNIERYQAQIASIDKLVSLATILVIIRPTQENAEEQEEEEDPGLGSYFGSSIAGGFDDGVRFLVDSIAWLLEVLVGGLLWWVIAGVCGVAAWRMKGQKAEAAVV